MDHYLKVLRQHYADFSGRARRHEFWMFTLVNAVISMVFAIVLSVGTTMMLADEEAGNPVSPFFILGSVLFILYGLAVFVPTLALTVRRLHDTGKSGWWYLLSFVPFGNLVVLVFTVLDSEPGANQWGPNPKGLAGQPSAPASW